ncbi:hypothetical protein NFI96_003661 [Prochilodus magdalenae]|nr:hypothetical protein NFI96_003661 [Prochilodus magdalenae]
MNSVSDIRQRVQIHLTVTLCEGAFRGGRLVTFTTTVNRAMAERDENLVNSKRSKTLIVRHLPADLSREEKEDLLKYFGASSVRALSDRGPLKHTAFATFSSETSASRALKRLHQLRILGHMLVVEFARDQDSGAVLSSPPVSDSPGRADQQDGKGKKEKQQPSVPLIDNGVAPSLGCTQKVIFSDESRFSLGGDAQRIRVWRHRGQRQDERSVVTRPEGLVSLHLHPYRTICRNCVRMFKLHGMEYHRTPLGTSTAPYRDVWRVGLANTAARRHTERQTSLGASRSISPHSQTALWTRVAVFQAPVHLRSMQLPLLMEKESEGARELVGPRVRPRIAQDDQPATETVTRLERKLLRSGDGNAKRLFCSQGIVTAGLRIATNRVLWAVSCGPCPVGRVLWAVSCGPCPVGRVLWAASCGQRPVPPDSGLEDDQHCTVQQQMSYRL